jgi:hypothetical protein
MSASETRVTNEKTGGQKGAKARRYSLLPWDELGDVAEHYAAGANKYAAHNWRKGYDWSLSADALMRHFEAWWEHRQSRDEEMAPYTPDFVGTKHLAAVVFHALTLMYFEKHHPELDDRPPLPLSREAAQDDLDEVKVTVRVDGREVALGTWREAPSWDELEEAPLCPLAGTCMAHDSLELRERYGTVEACQADCRERLAGCEGDSA